MSTRGRAIHLHRIYDKDAPPPGRRVLVDRIWPRGISKGEAALDDWLKEVAPSTALRKWFGHDPELWAEFRQKYIRELEENDVQAQAFKSLAALAAAGDLVLLYGARDREHNQAVVLRELLEKLL